jgi:hypothetical protein
MHKKIEKLFLFNEMKQNAIKKLYYIIEKLYLYNT